jgi:hypothetical protein
MIEDGSEILKIEQILSTRSDAVKILILEIVLSQGKNEIHRTFELFGILVQK